MLYTKVIYWQICPQPPENPSVYRNHYLPYQHSDPIAVAIALGLVLLTLSWDKNWDSHSPMNGCPSFYPRIALVAPSPDRRCRRWPWLSLSTMIGPVTAATGIQSVRRRSYRPNVVSQQRLIEMLYSTLDVHTTSLAAIELKSVRALLINPIAGFMGSAWGHIEQTQPRRTPWRPYAWSVLFE